jgi:hypothetical protein
LSLPRKIVNKEPKKRTGMHVSAGRFEDFEIFEQSRPNTICNS